ncbi:hypothetical protein K1W54_04465 [Micromonospora sp. CPCC 205371]|nr:hypothetical protein [Micromonospora sp. CPCC 205371]
MSGLPVAQWSPRQRELAKTSDPNDLRPCNIYLIIGRDPWVGVAGRLGALIVLYVGETWRTPAQRLEEHLAEQWWARDVAAIVAFPTQARNKAQAWEIERQLIRLFETPYNKEFNGSSRWLIIDGRPVHRNDLPAQPDWWPTSQVASAVWEVARPPSRLELWWCRRRWWVLGSIAAWLALFVGACWLAAKVWDGSTVPQVAAMAASVPLVGFRLELWRRRIQAWRRKRRRRRK